MSRYMPIHLGVRDGWRVRRYHLMWMVDDARWNDAIGAIERAIERGVWSETMDVSSDVDACVRDSLRERERAWMEMRLWSRDEVSETIPWVMMDGERHPYRHQYDEMSGMWTSVVASGGVHLPSWLDTSSSRVEIWHASDDWWMVTDERPLDIRGDGEVYHIDIHRAEDGWEVHHGWGDERMHLSMPRMERLPRWVDDEAVHACIMAELTRSEDDKSSLYPKSPYVKGQDVHELMMARAWMMRWLYPIHQVVCGVMRWVDRHPDDSITIAVQMPVDGEWERYLWDWISSLGRKCGQHDRVTWHQVRDESPRAVIPSSEIPF